MTISEIKSMRVGQKNELSHGYIIRKTRNSYCLIDYSNKFRSRWGTYKQISEDVSYFLTYGSLPVSPKEHSF
jgi:hypothetical protein